MVKQNNKNNDALNISSNNKPVTNQNVNTKVVKSAQKILSKHMRAFEVLGDGKNQ